MAIFGLLAGCPVKQELKHSEESTNLFSVELWQEFSRARFCSCPLPQCPQAHLSFSWILPEPVCPGWKHRLPCTKQNCFGQKPDYGSIGIHVHSLLCWILTKNDPEPLAAVRLTPRPLLSLVMVLRCHASVQGVSKHADCVCSWTYETVGRKGTGKKKKCWGCGDTNWLT